MPSLFTVVERPVKPRPADQPPRQRRRLSLYLLHNRSRQVYLSSSFDSVGWRSDTRSISVSEFYRELEMGKVLSGTFVGVQLGFT
jgi:hypothetical protein